MESPERICRFCFEKCDTNFKIIEKSTHEILNMLLITMNLAISDEPVVCTNCAEILQNSFVFKKTCLDIRAHTVAFDSDKNNGPGICNVCMNPLNNCSFTLLDIEDDLMSEKSMLEKYFPELVVNASEIPVICEACHGTLVNFISFITIFSIVEEKIKEYREAKCVNNTDPIKLSNILEFTSGNVCEEDDNKLGVVKMEYTIEENYGPNYEQKYCETPDINGIGQMEISSSLQCTIRDVTTGEVNGNSADIIKIEQFCEDRENPDEIEIGNGDGIIKLEPIFFDDSENANMQINNREVKNEPQFTPEDIWASAGGSDNLGSINISTEIKTDKQESDRTEDGVILPHSEVVNNLLESRKTLMSNLEEGYVKLTLSNKSVKKKSMYQCNYCSFCTERKESITRHLLRHKDPSEVTMYECDSCSYKTKAREYLNKHLLKHKDPSEVTMHKCEYCSYQTRDKSHLKRHSLRHKDPSEVTMYKCGYCSFQTKYKYTLKIHALHHKDYSFRMHKCGFCSYQTKYKAGLNRHLLRHKDFSEVITYKCESCSYQTKYKLHLKEHLLQHKDPSEVIMYKCESCSYQTKYKRQLKEHSLIHKDPSEVTMYQCDHCLYQTKYRRYLKTHVLKHKDPSEVTMYECDSCSYKTKAREYLNKHLLKHKDPSEVTMHKCEYCSYQTRDKSHFKRHSMRHKDPSEVTMYKCGYCSFQTKEKGNLKQHLLMDTN